MQVLEQRLQANNLRLCRPGQETRPPLQAAGRPDPQRDHQFLSACHRQTTAPANDLNRSSLPIYYLPDTTPRLYAASREFQEVWNARLGLCSDPEIDPDPWICVKALNRRFAEQAANEYDDLRPVAHLSGNFIEAISLFLDHPHGWTGLPPDDATRQTIISTLRRLTAADVFYLTHDNLFENEHDQWANAY